METEKIINSVHRTKKERTDILLDYVNGLSYDDIVKKWKICPYTISRAIKNFNHRKLEKFDERAKDIIYPIEWRKFYRLITIEKRTDILLDYVNGLGYSDILKKWKISPCAISEIIDAFNDRKLEKFDERAKDIPYPIERRKFYRLMTIKKRTDILLAYVNGLGCRDIIKKWKTSSCIISEIIDDFNHRKLEKFDERSKDIIYPIERRMPRKLTINEKRTDILLAYVNGLGYSGILKKWKISSGTIPKIIDAFNDRKLEKFDERAKDIPYPIPRRNAIRSYDFVTY